MDLRDKSLRWALVNAVEHGGKASEKAVAGKLFAEDPELRPRRDEVFKAVSEAVREVNRLSLAEQATKLKELGMPEKRQPKREKVQDLPDLNRYPQVVTRFAPNPNGPLHVGHARTALLSHYYARKYGGKFILRFEDTNPENAVAEMYDLIRGDLRWLGIDWDAEYTQSDRLKIYYKHAEELISAGKAYVCTCPVADFRKLRDRKRQCPCRGLEPGVHVDRWKKMLDGSFEENQAVVRMKTSLDHPNPAMRDWPALRISISPHPRTGKKYRVWPLYNFSASVDDHLMGVTHIIRGKEHEVNAQRQCSLYDAFGWGHPTAVQHGRLSLEGVVLSKTEIMKGIKEGRFSGYDDPRLGTLAALRRRGFLSESVRRLIFDIGLTLVDSRLSWDTLTSHNRQALDPVANRYFFVPRAVKLVVKNAPELKEVKVHLHPTHRERGTRTIPLAWEGKDLVVYLAELDIESLNKGEVFRLKDLMNVRVESKKPPLEAVFQGLELTDGTSKFQWVSAGVVEVEVLKPDGSSEVGLAEPCVSELEIGDIVQFERYGFVRVEEVKPKIRVVYAHR